MSFAAARASGCGKESRCFTVVAHMRAHGAELIGEMQYEDTYRLAYIRGPEGIIVALAEQLG